MYWLRGVLRSSQSGSLLRMIGASSNLFLAAGGCSQWAKLRWGRIRHGRRHARHENPGARAGDLRRRDSFGRLGSGLVRGCLSGGPRRTLFAFFCGALITEILPGVCCPKHLMTTRTLHFDFGAHSVYSFCPG